MGTSSSHPLRNSYSDTVTQWGGGGDKDNIKIQTNVLMGEMSVTQNILRILKRGMTKDALSQVLM